MPSLMSSDRYGAAVEVLASARREVAVTQVELARRLGRPQSYVSKVERRERRVDPVEFFDWSKALQVDPSVLFARLVSRLTQP